MSSVATPQSPRLPSTNARAAGPPQRRLSLADITTKGTGLPSRILLHGQEKVGKTSFAAYAPAPVFITTKGETGLQTLIDQGVIPETPHFPECGTWAEVMSALETLTSEEHKYKTLVIDTINGLERLCHEAVCARDFNGRWGRDGFTSYMQGYEVSLNDWRQFLIALDKLREVKKMSILGLCHTKIKNFKNPTGADYDRWTPDMHEKTWGLTHKWADIILFACLEPILAEKGGRAKGMGQDRIIYTVRHAAYDAGNRHNLPEEIAMGSTGKEAWANFQTAMMSAKATNTANAKGGAA